MDIGAHRVVRETYLSSLDLARRTLEELGLSHALAADSVRRFEEHDCKTLQLQRQVRDDEQQLIQTNELAMKELEQLFAADAEPEATGRE